MKKIILIVILGAVIFTIYQMFLKDGKPEYTLAEVKKGNVLQEIFETGQVQSGEEINLSFKSAGIIKSIYVKVGDEVWLGSNLARLDVNQLSIELSESQATLEVARAELDKLLAGSSPEEIQLAQTVLLNAQQSLKDVQAEAEEDLSQAYQDAQNTLENSYSKGVSALTTVTYIKKTYFPYNDQESIVVKNNEVGIEDALTRMRTYIDDKDTDVALSLAKDDLSAIYNAIAIIRDTTEITTYRDIVSKTDKSSLDTEKLNINTALTNVVNAQQTITSTKLDNDSAINTAQGVAKKAEDDLALKQAGARQVEVNLYQAKVRQAQAKVDLLENQIWEATLRSPTKGKITKVNKKIGEISKAAESVVSLLPASPYEIKADIYEEDVVKITIGNSVGISLIAFPEDVFKGKVISINPAEELIEGVVYYEVTIDFEEVPEGLKPGMTADLEIQTDLKENVIVVPEGVLEKKDGKDVVKIFKDGQIEEREVKVGLRGSNDLVEITAGLSEGESVIIE